MNDFISNESLENLRQNTNLFDTIYSDINHFLSEAVEYYEPKDLMLEMTQDIFDLLKRGGVINFKDKNPPEYLYGIKTKILNKTLNQINIRNERGELVWLRLY